MLGFFDGALDGLADFFEEVAGGVEGLVGGGESDVGDAVDLLEEVAGGQADALGGDFFFAGGQECVFDLVGQRAELLLGDGSLVAGLAECGEEFFAVEGDAGEVLLDDGEAGLIFGALVGGEALPAGEALAAAADDAALLAGAGVDDLVVVVSAVGTKHSGEFNELRGETECLMTKH